MKKMFGFLFCIMLAGAAFSAPPAPMPRSSADVIPEGGYVDFTVEVPKGAAILWRISPQPVQQSKGLPPGRLVFGGKKGTTYTATSIMVRYNKETDQIEMDDRDYVFVFGGTPDKTDPIGKDPGTPKDPVTPPSGLYYFLVVRADGPATSHHTKIMELPAWQTLRKAGHTVKDSTVSEATSSGITLPPGSDLPLVVILEGAKGSKILKAVPFPMTEPTILDLPKAVKS